MPKKYAPKGSRVGKGGKRSTPGTPSPAGVNYLGATREGCSSGKWAWLTRDGAKSLARVLRRQGDTGARAYLCPECCRFHVGHVPRAVREGRVSARDYYS